MAQLLPNIYQVFSDVNGNPLAGGLLYSYEAGTSTPQATYTDQTGGTPKANPIVLDAFGGAFVFIGYNGYKFMLTDSLGNLQWSADNVFLIEPGSIGSTQIAAGAVGAAEIADQAVGSEQIANQAVGTAQIANSSVEAKHIQSGAIGVAQLSSSIDFSSLTNMIEIVFKRLDDGPAGGRLLATPQFPWSNPSLLPQPATAPSSQTNDCKWSPDGRFIALGLQSSPFVQVYERGGLNFNALGTPGSLPPGAVNALCWSPNGSYLACIGVTSPYLTIYQRQGLVFTAIGTPGTIPGSAGLNLAWSPNGEFLATNDGSDIRLYNIGAAFTDISGSFGFTAGDGVAGCSAWSPDSQFLALGAASGTVFNCYKRTGVTGSGVTISGGQPATAPSRMAWSPNGQFLVMGISTTPFLACYSLSGTTLTKFTPTGLSGSGLPAGSVVDVQWSPNGQFIAVAMGSTPIIQVWAVNGTTWTKQPNPVNTPSVTGSGISWSPSSEFLSLATLSSPFIFNYQTSSSLPGDGMLWSRTWFDV